MFVKIVFHFLLVLIILDLEPCYVAGDVLNMGSVKMLLLYTGWQLDSECTGCWRLFDLLLIATLTYSILEGSIAIGRRLETRSCQRHMVAIWGSHCSCLHTPVSDIATYHQSEQKEMQQETCLGTPFSAGRWYS
jgi:hypothetical protein